MSTFLLRKTVLAAAALLCAAQASAQVTLYEHDGFRGRAFTADRPVWNLQRFGFNDLASSVVVDRGRWEVCEAPRFEGRCVVLRRGSYESLSRLGLNDRISSIRPVDDRRAALAEPEPLGPPPSPQWRPRPNERLFQVPVTSARSVVGPPEQRCWIERERVERPEVNVPGAVIGGVVGGILGHQIGRGTGRDVATVGGAVGGAALGANVDRLRDQQTGREVQRCRDVASTTPQYWDVTYNFRGAEHHVQMSAAPGSTITVNGNGEPRL